MPKLLNLETIYNARDYGGYKSIHGTVKLGRLYRTAHLANASEADLKALGAQDIGLIVDLRYLSERERQPNKWIAGSKTQTLAFDATRTGQAPHEAFIQNDLSKPEDARNYMMENYAARPDSPAFQSIFSKTLAHMAQTGDAMVVHCAAGKDRTGTVVAIIQSLLGVHTDDIISDYMLTMKAVDVDKLIGPAAKSMEQRFGREYDPEALRPMFGVEEAYLIAALDVIGDPAEYAFNKLRLSQSQHKALLSHYLEA